MYVYPSWDPVSRRIVSVGDVLVPPPGSHIRDYLLEVGRIEPLAGYDPNYVSIDTPDVLARLQSGDPSWEEMVPPIVAQNIRERGLLGYHQHP